MALTFRISTGSPTPIYRQIVDQVADQIACGRLRPGDRLPSVRELARALPVNQNTVVKAYESLEHDGLIVRRHGDGTFVAEGGSSLSAADRRRILTDLLGRAAMKAQLFDVSPAQLHALLDRELTALSRTREDVHE